MLKVSPPEYAHDVLDALCLMPLLPLVMRFSVFRTQASDSRGQGAGVGGQGFQFRVQDSGFRIQGHREREFLIDNLLVRIHLIIEMI